METAMTDTEIVYSTELVPNLDGREFKNPRHFLKPIDGVKRVYLADGWPDIRRAYEAREVEVLPLTAIPPAKQTKPKSPAAESGKPTS
jgi:hypothetical protein